MWTIFADGACSGNPGPGGWGTIVSERGHGTPQDSGIPPETHELGGHSPRTTNNQMELKAVIEGLIEIREASGEVTVYTDSVYVIRGITQWIFGWKSKGWKTAQGTPVLNEDYWRELDRLVQDRRHRYGVITRFKYVPGHKGVPANERVDEIAVCFSKKVSCELYQGPTRAYPVDLEKSCAAAADQLPERSGSSSTVKSSSKALGYLSLVGTLLENHSTWSSCQARVSGRPGAKFKKYSSVEEARQIGLSWGVPEAELAPKIRR
jgi:ribonuclease HI